MVVGESLTWYEEAKRSLKDKTSDENKRDGSQGLLLLPFYICWRPKAPVCGIKRLWFCV